MTSITGVMMSDRFCCCYSNRKSLEKDGCAQTLANFQKPENILFVLKRYSKSAPNLSGSEKVMAVFERPQFQLFRFCPFE
jgi:hypothetical protein